MTKNIVSLTATERRHIQRVLQDLTNLRIDEIRAAHAEHDSSSTAQLTADGR